MDQILLKTLEDVGFSDKEAKVYLALLELSSGAVSQVAQLTDLKTPIIYVVLEKLIKQGYVTKVPEKKVNEYQALDASIILGQAKLNAKNLEQMLSVFQTLPNKNKKRPKLHYIETKEGILKIYDEMINARQGFFVISHKKVKEEFPGAMERWVKNFAKSRFQLKGLYLTSDSPGDIMLAKIMKKVGQKVKILPGLEKMNMYFTVYDDKLAMTFLDEGPFMVLVESAGLFDSMKPITEMLWLGGKEI